MTFKKPSPLPGFGLTLGFTLFYLSAVVLIPLGALAWRTASLSGEDFWRLATTDRALAAYWLTFGASFLEPVPKATVFEGRLYYMCNNLRRQVSLG